MVAVTGATGGVGGRMAQALAASGIVAVLLRKHPETMAHLRP